MNKESIMRGLLRLLFLTVFIFTAFACGGGGSDEGGDTDTTDVDTDSTGVDTGSTGSNYTADPSLSIGSPQKVEIGNNNLAIVSGSSGIAIVDVSDTRNTGILSVISGNTYSGVKGNYVYVTNTSGLEVYNISDPTAPVLAGSVQVDGGVLGVTDNFLFVNVDINAVQIIDISNPALPIVAGTYTSSTHRIDGLVAIPGNNNYVYLMSSSDLGGDSSRGRMAVLDVSNPYNPVFISAINNIPGPRDSFYHNGYLHIFAGIEFYTVDVSNPSNPSVIGAASLTSRTWSPRAVTAAGNYMYISNNDGEIIVMDISNPLDLVTVSTFMPDTGAYVQPNDSTYLFHSIANEGNTLFLASQEQGLLMIDITNPSSLSMISTHKTLLTSHDVIYDQNYIIATSIYGLTVIPVDDFSNIIRFPASSGLPSGLEISNSTAWITSINGEITAVDISNPLSPSLISSTTLAGRIKHIHGNYAFLQSSSGTYANRMQIIDISNPASIRIMGSIDISALAVLDIKAGDSYAYVIGQRGYTDTFVIVDISNPSAPARVSRMASADFPGFAQAIDIDGNYAYITTEDPATNTYAGSDSMLQVIDVSNPMAPYIADNLNLSSDDHRFWHSRSLKIDNGYAYVGGGYSNSPIAIVDISTPTSLRKINTVDTKCSSGIARYIGTMSNSAYINSSSCYGIEIFNASLLISN